MRAGRSHALPRRGRAPAAHSLQAHSRVAGGVTDGFADQGGRAVVGGLAAGAGNREVGAGTHVGRAALPRAPQAALSVPMKIPCFRVALVLTRKQAGTLQGSRGGRRLFRMEACMVGGWALQPAPHRCRQPPILAEEAARRAARSQPAAGSCAALGQVQSGPCAAPCLRWSWQFQCTARSWGRRHSRAAAASRSDAHTMKSNIMHAGARKRAAIASGTSGARLGGLAGRRDRLGRV